MKHVYHLVYSFVVTAVDAAIDQPFVAIMGTVPWAMGFFMILVAFLVIRSYDLKIVLVVLSLGIVALIFLFGLPALYRALRFFISPWQWMRTIRFIRLKIRSAVRAMEYMFIHMSVIPVYHVLFQPKKE